MSKVKASRYEYESEVRVSRLIAGASCSQVTSPVPGSVTLALAVKPRRCSLLGSWSRIWGALAADLNVQRRLCAFRDCHVVGLAAPAGRQPKVDRRFGHHHLSGRCACSELECSSGSLKVGSVAECICHYVRAPWHVFECDLVLLHCNRPTCLTLGKLGLRVEPFQGGIVCPHCHSPVHEIHSPHF